MSDRGSPPRKGRTEAAISSVTLDGLELIVVSLPAPATELDAALTSAEREIVGLVLEGLTNAEIAARRRVSAKTVANQLRRIYRKLGIASRYELTAGVRG